MVINELIFRFAGFLNNTFNGVLVLTKEIEKNDIMYAEILESGYLQYAWETIVEMKACDNDEGLIPYGDGADFYDLSSRVLFEKKTATKQIFVIPRNSFDYISKKRISECKLEFNKLVKFDNDCFYREPPFHYVHCENSKGKVHVFNINEVNFELSDFTE